MYRSKIIVLGFSAHTHCPHAPVCVQYPVEYLHHAVSRMKAAWLRLSGGGFIYIYVPLLSKTGLPQPPRAGGRQPSARHCQHIACTGSKLSSLEVGAVHGIRLDSLFSLLSSCLLIQSSCFFLATFSSLLATSSLLSTLTPSILANSTKSKTNF